MGAPLREATASASQPHHLTGMLTCSQLHVRRGAGRVADARERPLRPLRRDDGGELDAVEVYGLGGHRH